jgi:hypothetical protein
MFFTIYKITNLINGKFYIGKHQTENLNDDYMGSGKLIKNAISKYGKDNFKKDILFIFDNEDLMDKKEKEIVTEDFCENKNTYNICIGGTGGFGYINSNPDLFMTEKRLKQLWTNKERSDRLSHKYNTDIAFRNKMKDNAIKAAAILQEKYPKGTFFGKTHKEETKQKMSSSQKGKHSGNLNSQFGTHWITNGSENKKIKNNDPIPEGWYRGRKV